ncbi:tetratricopeptide repeat protein [Desulforhopalus singaporensis]|uniref:Tetratricopeptide repeat-containing protein n=1 Tax=Desulforhopalus singaporensis TaxID=91360 RepID=A0A1H0V710_9BACT|nr:tetratricopeptide repeat protein [Desulforhopalus singaporensis]SDP74230.1 Tetratricopeptide repeat-containing protein [Desulforhopalus singaporensis]
MKKHKKTAQTGPATPKKAGVWEKGAIVAALFCLVAPFFYLARDSHGPPPPPVNKAVFIGSPKCADCHRVVYDKWQKSHHDLAMDKASDATVIGDFNNAYFTDPYQGVVSRFFREGDKFMVETEGPDGERGTFEIVYVFGVEPLQQYLVPFPGGRLQCLTIAWDTKKSQWYRLPPYEVKGPGDWLHWTRGGQNWNSMCAECHSTRVSKQYDMASNSYTTNWFAIDVGCEACHGPGSVHAEWAAQSPLARVSLANFGLAVQTDPAAKQQQEIICAPCHSRRYQLGDNDHTQGGLLDLLVPSLLEEGLYFPDGQIKDEVYEYGSFTQSRMYQMDVRCSDCHDVHSLKTHKQGNDLCLQCHRAEDYDTPNHHFHKKEHNGKPSEGHLCIRCHMPGKNYMGIDFRLDHSIRIPRVDLSQRLKTPNACSANGCHNDKSYAWIQQSYDTWYGKKRKTHYGEVIAAARHQSPDAGPRLIKLAQDATIAPIVRATALSLLRYYPGEASLAALKLGLQDENSLIRHTAIRNMDYLDSKTMRELVAPKLYDKVKAVRIEAAYKLAALKRSDLRKADLAAFDRGIAEYLIAMQYNGDFAPQRYNLGNLAMKQHKSTEAIRYYQQALSIDDQFYPAKVNLAMEYSRTGKLASAEKLFREVLEEQPDLYEVAYNLGLLYGEMGKYQQAATFLGKAADGMPQFARARYNQALALLRLQRWEDGIEAMEKVVYAEPENQTYFMTLADLYLRTAKLEEVQQLTARILKLVPDHAAALQLKARLPRP